VFRVRAKLLSLKIPLFRNYWRSGRLKRTVLRPWIRWNCPTTDETFPFGCVKRPLGRSWVLSQFANSVLSFVTVELLITIPHSSPPSYPSSPSYPPRPSRSTNPLVCLVSATEGPGVCALALFPSVSFRVSSPSFLSSLVRAHTQHILPSRFAGKGARLIKTFIFNCDFNCFPFAPRTLLALASPLIALSK